MITLTVKILGKYYKAESETLRGVVDQIKIPVVKGGSVVVVEKGNPGDEGYRKREKVFNAFITTNFFGRIGGKMAKDIAFKNFWMMFSDFN